MKFVVHLLVLLVVAVLAAYGYAYLTQDQMLMMALDERVNGVLRHAGTSTEEIAQWVHSKTGK